MAVPHAGVRAEDGAPFARALVQHFEPGSQLGTKSSQSVCGTKNMPQEEPRLRPGVQWDRFCHVSVWGLAQQ